MADDLLFVEQHIQNLIASLDVTVIDIDGLLYGSDLLGGKLGREIGQLMLQIVVHHVDDIPIFFRVLVLLPLLMQNLFHQRDFVPIFALHKEYRSPIGTPW